MKHLVEGVGATKLTEAGQPGTPGIVLSTDGLGVSDESVCAAAFILYLHQFTTDEEQCPTEFQKAAVNELRRKWAEQCLPSLTARHCGDCTNVCAPCVRCFTERLMQDARALLTSNV